MESTVMTVDRPSMCRPGRLFHVHDFFPRPVGCWHCTGADDVLGEGVVVPDTMNRDGIRSSAQFSSGARGVPRELPPTTAAPQPHARWCGALWEQLGLRRPVRPW